VNLFANHPTIIHATDWIEFTRSTLRLTFSRPLCLALKPDHEIDASTWNINL